MAEDDSLLVHIYEKKFKASGYDIEFAMDGEQAISKLKNMEIKPALVMLDGQMPRKGGFEVLQEMKLDSELKDIPVIFLTNMYEEDNEKKGIALGVVAYLIKSQYIPSEIVAKVKEICEKYNIK
jgi:putative two-component system response regulator